MTDPKRVEVVARALCINDNKDPNRPIGAKSLNLYQWQEYSIEADSIIRALDAHDAANGIARVKTIAACNGGV